MAVSSSFFKSPVRVLSSAIVLRIILFTYGFLQDAYSPMKYTDIDYYVFTDASRFLVHPPHSPYARETYRYTPLLAWILLPTTFQPQWFWFSFGKLLFAVSDVVAGWLIYLVLRREQGMSTERALKFASIWLLNPMVAAISTRGSSEGLLGVLVVVLLWAVLGRKFTIAGVVLGLGVHFKIYPFIYAPSIIWWMDDDHLGYSQISKGGVKQGKNLITSVKKFFNEPRIVLTLTSLSTFMVLNTIMYILYGFPFLQHTYLHHVTRLDHRHNFSPYNTLLYLTSALPASPSSLSIPLSSLAFLPQLLLSTVFLPLLLAKKDLPSTLLAQTFAFVSFNKVCTSQYFLWYQIFLPFYLPRSTLLQRPRIGLLSLALWVGAQALWLQQGFQLEFLGRSTFVPGLWSAGILFFLTNCWLLGIIVDDIGGSGKKAVDIGEKEDEVSPGKAKRRVK